MTLYDAAAAILEAYPSAVISLVGTDGYPLSLRCNPVVDKTQGVLKIQLPDNLPLAAGDASLLCHSHNEELFDLRSVTIEGRLEKMGDIWQFRATKLTQVMGRSKFLEFIQDVILKPRRNTKRYLEKAHLPRPSIDWARLKALAAEADKDI
ncbi:MAG: hypothetical protein ABI690_04990 [Chloroflexota bacterium]